MSHAAMNALKVRILCHAKIDRIKKERLDNNVEDFRYHELTHAEGLLRLAQEASGDIFVTAGDLANLNRGMIL